MTRVGWVVLGAVVLIAALFASMVRLGGPERVVGLPEVRFEPSTTVAARPDGLPVLQVPVQGVTRNQIADTWGQARSQGRVHHGTDIIAPGGTPVLAAADGTVEKLFDSRLGGTTLYERSVDRRWTFYYAHLRDYAPGVHEGQAVRVGDVLGYVGDTGDAGPGNYHLHFSLARLAPEQHWWQGEDINAYPVLRGR
ncbi:M23 family metallopeptidase [Sphingomonas sp.]|uniref:M23 family metallopeptidase n=1 Tax=Sphingomonas sp. TaxID=28214 RepID=UPI003CC6CF8A